MRVVDAVLHKATDEIIRIDYSVVDFSKGIIFSRGMEELERFVKDNPHCCMIDLLKNVCPLVDRLRIQQILGGLYHLDSHTKYRIRAPQFLKVDDFRDCKLKEKLFESKLSFPCIVKPQAACGVPHAHQMALVFTAEDFENLQVPLPAIVQEYVDHGSTIYKIYVLGEKIFYAVKKSMPNASTLLSQSEMNQSGPITFDSLKSLPTKKDDTLSGKEQTDQQAVLDLDLITAAAKWLRGHLDLAIFGFDVVIQEGSGDHVVVDLNYLPSFKEVPDNEAVPAFWDAIKQSYQVKNSSLHTPV
ncbi:inositol 1,3,4-trisphosphate 5/6-kinase 4 isoform X2 [Wolffia australiana]